MNNNTDKTNTNIIPEEGNYMNNNTNKNNSKTIPEEGKCGSVCQEINGTRHCEDICSSEGGLARVALGIVLPKGAPSGLNIFELCQDEKCVEAGSVGSYGDESNFKDFEGSEPPQIDKEKYILRDTDVTHVLVEQGWTLKKPLVGKMTKSAVGNLPEPVVMYHQLSKDGDIDKKMTSITLNPKETPDIYGNLLDGYLIKKIEKQQENNNTNNNADESNTNIIPEEGNNTKKTT